MPSAGIYTCFCYVLVFGQGEGAVRWYIYLFLLCFSVWTRRGCRTLVYIPVFVMF